MATIYTTAKIKITVYPDDHLPPHFHVRTVNGEALVLIETLAVHRGEVTPATRKAVWGWVEANVSAIAAEWNRINPRFPIA